jgi:hypothetical protein
MQIQTIKTENQKIRIAIQGNAGSGKTLSALLISYGIVGTWSKICVIDTEHRSASLYNNLGSFTTIQIDAPFTVAKFCEAIELCERAAIEVIILDSISSEWVGEGGIIDQYCSTDGNEVSKYDAVIPNHHVFISSILDSNAHVIATVRSTETNVFQQDGYAHYFMTVLKLNEENEATIIKDRTGLFKGICPVVLSENIGALLYKWCNLNNEVNQASQIQLANGKLANGKLIPIS